jgi:hypothetical protein
MPLPLPLLLFWYPKWDPFCLKKNVVVVKAATLVVDVEVDISNDIVVLVVDDKSTKT